MPMSLVRCDIGMIGIQDAQDQNNTQSHNITTTKLYDRNEFNKKEMHRLRVFGLLRKSQYG